MFFVDADLSDKSIKGIVDKSCGRQLSLTIGERLPQVIVIQRFWDPGNVLSLSLWWAHNYYHYYFSAICPHVIQKRLGCYCFKYISWFKKNPKEHNRNYFQILPSPSWIPKQNFLHSLHWLGLGLLNSGSLKSWSMHTGLACFWAGNFPPQLEESGDRQEMLFTTHFECFWEKEGWDNGGYEKRSYVRPRRQYIYCL